MEQIGIRGLINSARESRLCNVCMCVCVEGRLLTEFKCQNGTAVNLEREQKKTESTSFLRCKNKQRL